MQRSSDNSWAESNIDLIFGDEPQAAFEKGDIKGPVPLAAAFEGEVVKNSGKMSRVVVFGDADFVANVNIRQLFNRDFFLNALNWVIGETHGVSIRPRTLKQSMTAITTEQFATVFVLTAILLPELVLLGGLSVWWLRKKES